MLTSHFPQNSDFFKNAPDVRAAAHIICNSLSHMPCHSRSMRFLWNLPSVRAQSHASRRYLPSVRAQSHASRRYLAVERPQVMPVEWIGLVLFCVACSSVAGLQPVRTSGKIADLQSSLSLWIKNGEMIWPVLKVRNCLEYPPPCMNQCRIYTSMDITTKPIAVVMGKGQDDEGEVVGQGSFTSPTGCCLSIVAHVSK